MPLRLIEVVLPKADDEPVRALLEESVIHSWQAPATGDGLLLKILLSAEQSETILDALEEKFGSMEGFRVVLLPVEATIPRVEEPEKTEEESAEAEGANEGDETQERISREELYNDIVDDIKLSKPYVALVVLSAVVAAVGLMQDNVAVVIGAMVIAPLLGPNVGLALATTLGDFDLGRRALKTNLLGVGLALSLAILFGLFTVVDPTVDEIASRTRVGLPDIALALASGSAGVLAFTGGVATALIGVMVAVALLPPLVAFGLLLGAGYWPEALGALLLLVTNLICVNLAGVTTFLAQGIRPRHWWEADKAERATRWAIALWSLLLMLLVTVIILSQRLDWLTLFE